jgi:hypothetical protein
LTWLRAAVEQIRARAAAAVRTVFANMRASDWYKQLVSSPFKGISANLILSQSDTH